MKSESTKPNKMAHKGLENVSNNDFCLFKRMTGSLKDKTVNPYSISSKRVEVTTYVAMDFSPESLINFEMASGFILDLDDELVQDYVSMPNADYLFVYHFGMDDQIVFPYSREGIMEFAKLPHKKRSKYEGFYLCEKLCDHYQSFYINRATKELLTVKEAEEYNP